MSREAVIVNRAPVLTLWAAVVAERLGFDRRAALSLGKALAGLNAQSKGRSLGIFKPAEHPEGVPREKVKPGEEFRVELLGRAVPATTTAGGVRAVVKDMAVGAEGVERYLEEKFGPALPAVAGSAWSSSVISKASSGLRTTYARRLRFTRCCGPTLSEVMLPAAAPHPRVIEGNTLVVMPVEPCGAGVLTSTRLAGMRAAYSRIRASSFE